MPTTNRSARHNFHWHSRPANDPIGFIGDIEYTYHPQARDAEGPFLYDPYSQSAYLPALAPDAGDDIPDRFNPLCQGMTHEPKAGLADFRMRDFSPALQRWMPQDHSCMTLTRSPPIGRPRHPTPATTIPTASILCTRV